jgi:hypothetical protein
VPDMKIAYVAGLFEGEGSVSCNNQAIQLSIRMCDLEPLQRCAEYTNLGNISGPHPGTNKPRYAWSVYGWDQILFLYNEMYDWLSPRRHEQFQTALATRLPHYLKRKDKYSPECGLTVTCSGAGAQRHRRNGEYPCESCYNELSAYNRNR